MSLNINEFFATLTILYHSKNFSSSNVNFGSSNKIMHSNVINIFRLKVLFCTLMRKYYFLSCFYGKNYTFEAHLFNIKEEMLDLKQLTGDVCRIATEAGHFLKEERKNFRRESVVEKHAHDYVSYVDKESEVR